MDPFFLHRTFLGNEVAAYLAALGLLLGGLAGVWIFRYFLLKRVEAWASRTQTQADDYLIAALRRALIPALYFGVLYLAVRRLALHPAPARALTVFGAVLITFMAVRFILQLARFGLFELWARRRADAATAERQMRILMPVVTAAAWTMGAVFLLDNLGFRVSAIVTGLGIGGVAVALGAQAVLGDMFSYFAIMLDRPFEIEDFIVVGDFMGTVEHVGIKTTRLRSLGGEQLVFSNKDLTDSRLRNFKRMQVRRAVFRLGLTYGTGAARMRRALELVRRIIEEAPETRFDRAHFASFGDFSLVIEAVYFVLNADYARYMDIQQQINFALLEAFEREGIEFAFPTQTIELAKP